jgi:hypothetical protein
MSVNPNRLPELPSLPPEHYAVFRQRIRDGQGWKLLLTLVVAPVAIWLLLMSLLTLLQGARSEELSCALRNCGENPTGPPAPWVEQLAAAHQAAHREDPNAVLMHVSAGPVAEWPRTWTYSDTLEVRFDYELSGSGDLWITLQDSSPATTVKVDRHENRDANPLYKQVHQEIMGVQDEAFRRAESVKLSPREVVALTWDEAERTEKHGSRLAPSVGLTIVNMYDPALISSDTWQVDYWYVPKQVLSELDLFFPRRCFTCPQSYKVDGATGEILERQVNGIVLSGPLP